MATKMIEAHTRAQGALHASPIYALRELQVDGAGDEIRISGHVATFYHKQLAQELVLSVAQGKRVVNAVSVS
jgi:hypothetical protein